MTKNSTSIVAIILQHVDRGINHKFGWPAHFSHSFTVMNECEGIY